MPAVLGSSPRQRHAEGRRGRGGEASRILNRSPTLCWNEPASGGASPHFFIDSVFGHTASAN
ncbi:hypothetical protein NMC40_18810 [Proteus mirabilis]|nr:hypothetical protein [Proteus mirabilis]